MKLNYAQLFSAMSPGPNLINQAVDPATGDVLLGNEAQLHRGERMHACFILIWGCGFGVGALGNLVTESWADFDGIIAEN